MGNLYKNCLLHFMSSFKFIITIILILDQVKDGVQNNSSKDSRYLDDSYDNNLPLLRRHGRQTRDSGCVIPVYPLHTKYKALGQTAYSTNSGDFISNFVAAEVVCDKGFKLSPLASKRSICIRERWTPPLSHCLRACPSLTSIASTNVSCMHGTIPLNNCYDAVENTTVLMACNPLYEDSSIANNPIHLCLGGRWEPSIPQCSPVCGQKRPVGVVNIVNGIDVVRGDYPWHVGIYNASDQGYLCGGSIIDRNIILSAAHCFADYNGNVFPLENFLIAAGKYHRTYNHESDTYAQYTKIQKINIPERYKGIETFHALDVAVLIVETPLSISSTVQPVCIELNQQLESLHLTSNSIGIVTGWGYTQEGDQLADTLKEVQIPFIPYKKCYDEVPRSFRKYLNDDKICGGYKDLATSICTGDSGGGLIFHNRMNDRFYLKGIVSTSPATISQTCDSNQYSLYSSIAVHTKFIRDVLTRNRFRTQVECIASGCTSEDHQTEKPQTLNDLATFRIVCYYIQKNGRITPENINPFLCTHIVYAFAHVTDKITLKPDDENAAITLGGYAKFTGLKNHNKDLKALLYVGSSLTGTKRFVSIAADAEKRQKLVNNSIAFLRQHNFDGLQLSWLSPNPKEKDIYSSLIKDLHEGYERESIETGRPRLLLTIWLTSFGDLSNTGYDLPKISRYLDWIGVDTFDYKRRDKNTVNHHSQLYGVNGTLNIKFNANFTINYVAQLGAPKEKLVLGISTYGETFTLHDPSMTAFGSKVSELGSNDEQSQGQKILAYFKICKKIKDEHWAVVRPYPNAVGPYAYKYDQWMSYDDEFMVKKKVQYALSNKLGGISFWTLEQEDYLGHCTGKQFPLINAAKEALKNK